MEGHSHYYEDTTPVTSFTFDGGTSHFLPHSTEGSDSSVSNRSSTKSRPRIQSPSITDSNSNCFPTDLTSKKNIPTTRTCFSIDSLLEKKLVEETALSPTNDVSSRKSVKHPPTNQQAALTLLKQLPKNGFQMHNNNSAPSSIMEVKPFPIAQLQPSPLFRPPANFLFPFPTQHFGSAAAALQFNAAAALRQACLAQFAAAATPVGHTCISPANNNNSSNNNNNNCNQFGKQSMSSMGSTPAGHKWGPIFPPAAPPNFAFQPQQQYYDKRRTSTINKPAAVKKYKCDVCGKAFSRSNTLVTHKRIHTGEKPFKCEHCGRAFRQPGNLTRHRLTHTTVKPYICSQCGKAFNRASNLHTHMRTHTNYRPFTCPFCGKGFHQKIDMKIHSYTHTGERPYKCDICQKGFTLASTLNAHHRTHADMKPYGCDHCDKHFYQRNSLKSHVLASHPYIPGSSHA